MTWLIIGLILFHGLHSLRMIVPKWRDAKYAEMGESKWKGLYSLASLIALVMLIYGYSVARPDADIVYVRPDWGPTLAALLMLPAFILMTFNMRSSRLKFITHHPFLLAIILWSLAHLFANGDTASVLLFGSFIIWASFNFASVRKRTVALPPVKPILQDGLAIFGGIVLWAVFLFGLHEWLFGVAPIMAG